MACAHLNDFHADILVLQEHRVGQTQAMAMRAELRRLGWSGILSPADTATGRPTAGVGVIVRDKGRVARVSPATDAFQ
eukprot:3821429-Alexandrium_andersonii.AAC.1